MKRFAVAAALLAAASAAQAGVVYDWVTTSLPDNLQAFGGRIEFADQAVPVSLNIGESGTPEGPIQRITFFFTDADGERSGMPVPFNFDFERFIARITLTPEGDRLTGSINMTTPHWEFVGAGSAAEWLVTTFQSDDTGTLCAPRNGDDVNCGGITGFWALANDVPVPGTLALMAMAGLGIVGVRRRG